MAKILQNDLLSIRYPYGQYKASVIIYCDQTMIAKGGNPSKQSTTQGSEQKEKRQTRWKMKPMV
jgi:hypothetical protein